MDQPPKVLLVEGQDDKHVVLHLLGQASSMSSFDVQDKGNIDELLKAIEPEVRAPGRAAVGIVADANDDLDARWAAISNRLQEAEIEVPKAPCPTGTIISGAPRVGVWLMPDNRKPGELEDFVQEMIPNGDPAWPLAQRYVRDIPEGARKFPPGKERKAKPHAWLATRETPGRMGSAIRRGDLNTDGALCKGILAWIEQLFG